MGRTRQMSKHESRGQRTGARTEGQPGFSAGTEEANIREQPRTEERSWSQDGYDGSSLLILRKALIYSLTVLFRCLLNTKS